MDFNINIPNKVLNIIETLENSGYEAYVVGGCVRDALLGVKPKDWDITTNAKPNEVQAIFEKTIPTGIKHGTITVMLDGEGFEVTTYRVDGEYTDGRHPDKVEYTSNLKDDLARRDFTINAMAYNPKVGLVDEFDGVSHLEEGLINTVGYGKDRFSEDALRILRGIRFANNLGFSLSTRTKLSMISNVSKIVNVSAERVQMELNKILLNEDGCEYGLRKLKEVYVLDKVIPELANTSIVLQNNPYHIYNVFEHTVKVTNYIENELHLKLAALLHDIGKFNTRSTDEEGVDHFYGHEVESVKMAENILKRLRYDNATISKVLTLIKYHDRGVEPTHKSVKKFLNKIGDYSLFSDWLKLKWADIQAQNPKFLKDRCKRLVLIECIGNEIISQKQPFTVKELEINGNDLIALGYKGKEIGIVLNKLLDIVIEEPNANNKDYLLMKANELLEDKFKNR